MMGLQREELVRVPLNARSTLVFDLMTREGRQSDER
jgi:hypothetical protein